MPCENLLTRINSGGFDKIFTRLYPQRAIKEQAVRLENAILKFNNIFGNSNNIGLFSAPGRTEVCGNHTDHQRGRVLAAAVNLDVLCAAAPNGLGIIRLHSDGYPRTEISLKDLMARDSEKNTTAALIRGVAAAFQSRGYCISGFDAYVTSDVLRGSGLSSSAAFEVALGMAISGLFNRSRVSPVEIAQFGQYAENKYFGKPSGLMDQMASAIGGFVEIDFADPEKPAVNPVRFDFSRSGHALFIIDTRGNHADLTDDYAAIPAEMRLAAEQFGKQYLRQVAPGDFYARLGELRGSCGDRAILRAMHFFSENDRVSMQARALNNNDFNEFLRLTNASGHSSASCLQNAYSCSNPRQQGLSVALAVSELLLNGKGAQRVHGGGFAGTIQAFVPSGFADEYCAQMEAVFGDGACHRLAVRPVGCTEIT